MSVMYTTLEKNKGIEIQELFGVRWAKPKYNTCIVQMVSSLCKTLVSWSALAILCSLFRLIVPRLFNIICPRDLLKRHWLCEMRILCRKIGTVNVIIVYWYIIGFNVLYIISFKLFWIYKNKRNMSAFLNTAPKIYLGFKWIIEMY